MMNLNFDPKTLQEILTKDVKQAEREISKYDAVISNIQDDILEINTEIKICESKLAELVAQREMKVEECSLVQENKLQVVGAVKMYTAKMEK